MVAIYIYVDAPDDVKDFAATADAVRDWTDGRDNVTWIHRTGDDAQRGDLDAGIELNARRASDLKVPLNALYSIARQFRCDFVVGKRVESGFEDVCYFGAEEGRPDMFEVATYLGI